MSNSICPERSRHSPKSSFQQLQRRCQKSVQQSDTVVSKKLLKKITKKKGTAQNEFAVGLRLWRNGHVAKLEWNRNGSDQTVGNNSFNVTFQSSLMAGN